MLRMSPRTALRNALLLPLVALLAGCEKELDAPSPRSIPAGGIITVAELKAMFVNQPVHFNDTNLNIVVTVTADETDGNFYKNVYAQDSTGGICLRLLNSGGLYIGDKIRVYLPGTVLSPYNGLMQLDSVNVDNNTVKWATGVHVEPLVLGINELDPVEHQSMLIRLADSVEFISADAISGTWADAVNNQSLNRTLEDCDGNQLLVRTSGYANYAWRPLPKGRGIFTGVLGVFGTDLQMYVRRLNEVLIPEQPIDRCPGQELPFFVKDFQDQNLLSGGWIQKVIGGSTNWIVQDLGSTGNFYAVANNYSNGEAAETWLISPAMDITGLANPRLSFQNASRFAGPVLETLVSTNYDGVSDPSTATWTALAPILDLNTGAYVWTNSGALDISAYSSTNFRVAFKYTAPAPSGSAWEVDDIKIFEP